MGESEAMVTDEKTPTPTFVTTNPAVKTDPPQQGNNITNLLRKCAKCPKVFDNRRKLTSHVYHVHGRLFYQCTLCNNVQRKPSRLRHHLIKKHQVLPNSTANYVKRFHEYDNKVLKPQNKIGNPNAVTLRKKTLYFKKRTLSFKIKCFNCYDCPASFGNVKDLFQHVKIHKELEYEMD